MSHICDYVVIKSDDSAIIEVCSECKKKLVTKLGTKGRIDNKAYLAEHSRDTAQPIGATAKVFKKYHGNNQTEKTS